MGIILEVARVHVSFVLVRVGQVGFEFVVTRLVISAGLTQLVGSEFHILGVE